MYYVLFESLDVRSKMIEKLKQAEINTVFHYIPLHSSPAGKKYTRTVGSMEVTDRISDTLLRLPMFYTLSEEEIKKVCESFML